MRWTILALTVALPAAGCGTLSGARPLERGQHEVGVVLGGPMFDFGVPLPLPNVVVGARSGVASIADRPFDLGYGINATGLAFGIVGLHADAGWLVLDQNGGVPALTVRNKLFVSSNFAASSKLDGAPRGVWGADEIDLIASWKVDETVVYGSLGQVFDFADPGLLLVPGIGASIDPGRPGGLVFNPEVRWWGINRSTHNRNVAWIPSRPGAIGIHLGFAGRFGGAK